MSDTNEVETLDVYGRLAMQTAVAKVVKGEVDATRALAAASLQPGDRRAARHDGVKLGAVTLTDPSWQATVTDRAQFLAHVVEAHPSEVAMGWRPRPGVSWEDVAAVLAEFDEGLAAEYVEQVPAVAAAFETKVLAAAAASESAVVPGVERSQKAPVLQVRLEAAATDRARALLQGDAMPELGGAA
ncbi:hypothetical protein [Tsukamurella tyrosinosolvens]|uniref:hypothetical protein n=1 Tax=Tsukamurella tyrosinosolvens TaxID=57704 RepID=UPI0034634051